MKTKTGIQLIKLNRLLFILVMCLCCSEVSTAQTKKITGTIVDNKKEPVPYCNVVLKTLNDSTFVTGCVTDDNGNFTLSVSDGFYKFHVSYIGYNEYKQALTVNKDIKLNTITLSEATVVLDELVVEGKRKASKSESDVYYLNESPKTMGRNALEVISLASGVTVSGGNIKIYGKEGVGIMINGRMLQLKGKDLNKYLASINGEDIATMEIDRATNAAYDANVTAGVIKIKLRTHQENGYDASLGIKGKVYKSTLLGVNPKFSINSKVGKFNIYGNLEYSSIGDRDNHSEDSNYKGKNVGISTHTDVNTKIPDHSYFMRLGAMYDINEHHSIGLDMDGTYERNDEESLTPSTIVNSTGKKDYFVDYYCPDSIRKYNVSLNYIWKINKSGSQLNLGSDYYYQKANTIDDNTMTCIQDAAYLKKSKGTIQYHRNIYTLGADFKWVCNPRLTLDIGSKFNSTVMKDYLNYWSKDDNKSEWKHDTDNTDNMKYKESILAGFINGDYTFGNWSINAGVRYEQTLKETESQFFSNKNSRHTYHNLFPMFTATYDLNKEKGHHLSLKYRSGIARPSFEELVPYISQQNLYSYVKGNPTLSPSYNYSANLDLLLFDAFYFGAGYTIDKDKVELIIKPRDSEGLIMDAIYENVKKVSSYSLQTFVPIPVTKKMYFGLTLMGARKVRDLYNETTTDKLWQYYAELEANLTLPHDFTFETNFSYINKEFYGNMTLKNHYTLNFDITKSFLNKKLQLSFAGTNILGKKRILSIDDNYISRRVVIYTSSDTSLFSLSVRYAFNSNAKVKAKRVKAFNTEERER